MKSLITGNEAIAYGALRAGVKVVTGYPGTPSTGAIASLLTMDLKNTYVEWSTNEKVALEIAAGVAWAGHKTLCTMKMSGVNVAYDSLISIAYSGVEGALVIYVADDPGTSAGMCEQDSRGFALMSDMPMLEPATVEETYTLTQYAFELSEKAKTPVFIRLVTALANSFASVEIEEPGPVSNADALLIHDINRFTKAGAAICMGQHRDLIRRLEICGRLIEEKGINTLSLSPSRNGLGIVACGLTAAYLDESLEILKEYGIDPQSISILKVAATVPFPRQKVHTLLEHCNKILVLEELEAYIEKDVCAEAFKRGYQGQVLGKLNGLFSRIGEYGVPQVVSGVASALEIHLPAELFVGNQGAEASAAARPITTCAGCPHRGTYMAINRSIRKARLKQEQVMVTGDIGCTILGMNAPFNTIWNEISMGASVSLAQGFVYAGVKTPVLATIGDSTFFHGGIPGLINAIQHQVNMTLIIMDNGWTAMTGMQVNPGTESKFQNGFTKAVDIARIIPALGVENFFIIDPFDLDDSTAVINQALALPGVKVVLSRRECAIQSRRYQEHVQDGKITVIVNNCNLCKLCVMATGCAALSLGENAVIIDDSLCTACGLCVEMCNRDALIKEVGL